MAVPTRDTNDAQVNEFNAFIRSQPWYQQFFAQRGLNPNQVELSREDQAALEKTMAANGLQVPGGMHIDQAGNLNQKNTLKRNIGIGAAIGGAALTGFGLAGMGPLSGLGGGAAASTGGTAIGSGMGYGPASLAGSSGIAAANATPAVAGAVGGSIWSKLAPSLVGAGLQAVGSYQQSRAANNAAQQQMQASERALDFSKQIYGDQKANQQPFINVGHGAVNTLGGLMGIPQPQAPQAPPPNTAQPRGPLGSMGAEGSMVIMRAPDGSTRPIPADKVPYFESRGAQRIN